MPNPVPHCVRSVTWPYAGRRRSGSTGALAAAAMLLAIGSAPGVFPSVLSLEAQAPSSTSLASVYRDHASLTRALDSLQRAYPRLVTVSTIGQSAGGRALHAVRLGAGGAAADGRPALLVVANASGPQVLGSEISVAAVGRIAAGYGRDSASTRLLDGATIYFIPRLNPDAAEALFQSPLVERLGNDAKSDDDHDGAVDEDGPDDLNRDGVISMMRVQDPNGAWMLDPAEPFLLRRADATRGERGGWSLYVEGRDNDGDGRFNEDGPGGTDVSRNFTNGYRPFVEGSGLHTMSASEAKAIGDFMIAHPNIYTAYVLGPQDNLVKPWEFRRLTGIGGSPTGTSAGGPLLSILQPDEAWNAEVSRRYRSATGQSKAPSAALEGDVLSWMYYDMGRIAFGSAGWDIPNEAGPGAGQGATPGAGSARPDPIGEERNALRWLRANAPSSVIEWTRIEHPDFPGRTVEIGGIRPFARAVPPAQLLSDVLTKQSTFIAELAGMLPKVALREIRVEALGDRTFRVSAQVANNGYFPTQSAIGARARWQRAVRVDFKTSGDQRIVSGRAVQLLGPIDGSGRSTTLTWVVVAAPGSTITLEAASPGSGRATESITLRAR